MRGLFYRFICFINNDVSRVGSFATLESESIAKTSRIATKHNEISMTLSEGRVEAKRYRHGQPTSTGGRVVDGRTMELNN